MYNPFIQIINQTLSEPQAGLLNGILFGIKANLPKNFYQDLITTGTIHIIALSGQNIAIMTRLIAEFTVIIGRRISCLLTISFIIFFVIFVGGQPTIIRAAMMGSMSLFSVYFGRQNWSLLSLFLAAGIMLIINPAWIGDLSFQLSFLATLGIIIFGTPKVNIKQNKNKWIEEIKHDFVINLRTTLSAQLFTLPIILFNFQQISLVSTLTNVLIGWVIAPIMTLGFILSLFGLVWLPFGKIIGFLVWVPLTYLIKVVELTAKIPFAVIKF